MYQCLKVENRKHRDQLKPSSLRKEGWVPGVIFGKEIDSVSLQVKEQDLWKFLHQSGAVFEIEVGGTKHLCNLDSIQKDALGRKAMHVSFHKLKAGQKTTVSVPLQYVGEAPGVKAGGVLNLMVDHIDIEGLPKDIPESVEIDLSSVDLDGAIQLSDIATPSGCIWKSDSEMNLLSCHAPKVIEESTEAAEPEVIGEETAAESTSEEEIKEAS